MVAPIGSLDSLISMNKNPGLESFMQGQQAVYNPQVALARAMYYQGRGAQGFGAGNLSNTKANLYETGAMSPLGQLIQAYSNNPSIAGNPEMQALVNTAINRTANFGGNVSANSPAALGQIISSLEQYDPQNPALQSYKDTYNAYLDKVANEAFAAWQEGRKNKAEADLNVPSEAAAHTTEAQKNTQEATNLGYSGQPIPVTPGQANQNSGSPNLPSSGSQQPLPQGNFSIDWSPQQQQDYISKNVVAPPLPKGASAMTQKVDQRTETFANGLGRSAQVVGWLKDGMQLPYVQKYMGKNVPQGLKRAYGEFSRTGVIPEGIPQDYADYLAFTKTAATQIDSLANTLTNSRAWGMFQQYLEGFDPAKAINWQQENSSLQNIGNILYNEGTALVGNNYDPGLRQNAYNGVRLLQKEGFAPAISQEESDNNPMPAPGMTKEQYRQWYEENKKGQ